MIVKFKRLINLIVNFQLIKIKKLQEALHSVPSLQNKFSTNNE